MIRWEYLLSGIIACAAVLALDRALGTRLAERPRFWAFLGIMLLCQLAFDGYLTARPVTLYDPCCHLGPRLPLLNMPIEDLPFGLALVGLAAVLWEWAGTRSNGRTGEQENRR
ncbi:MAG: lycopene cyclase domain-containing protein [Thermomicrobiales bacterium]